jgi:hypothetical protein
MVLGHLLASVQPQSFLELTHVSLEPFLAEFYTVLIQDHHQVALQKLEMGICSSLSLQNWLEQFTDFEI